jgi:magnesium transporter
MGKEKEIIEDNDELIINFEELHPSEIAKILKKIYKSNSQEFFEVLQKIPDDFLGEVLLELPENLREEAYKSLSIEKLTDALEELETDDMTDIIQELEEIDEQKATDIFENLEEENQQEINWLRRYEDDEAGAFMQTELFSASLDEKIGDAVKRLKKLKKSGELFNINQVFVIDENQALIASIPLEDLIIYDFDRLFDEIIDDENPFKAQSVESNEDIKVVVKKFEEFDLDVLAVVGYKGRLIGRITSDDIIDVIEQSATNQIYQLAGVNDDYEHEKDFVSTSQKRGVWLGINLLTAIFASLVIGLFEQTIAQYVALAVLMPIVASMGGNAGTQTLTVMVRQLALGEIDFENSKDAIKKEVFIALFNGFIFAILVAIVAFVWFGDAMLGVVIGLAMILNLFAAGFFGAIIPLVLKKYEIDPAVGSSVVLTTVTDIVGFFCFLGLAKIILL